MCSYTLASQNNRLKCPSRGLKAPNKQELKPVLLPAPPETITGMTDTAR